MNEKKRIPWIDTARGFAILFVVFGHIGNELSAHGMEKDAVYDILISVMNIVKLPLFFAVSGFLISAKFTDIRYFAARERKTRLIPYLIWGTFMGLVGTVTDMYRCGFDGTAFFSLLWENYLNPFPRGNLIWFVPCLLVLEILFFVLLTLSRGKLRLLVPLTVLTTVSGYLVTTGETVPWKADTALVCSQFMTFGYLCRRWYESDAFAHHGRLCMRLSIPVFPVLFAAAYRIWDGCPVDVNQGIYFQPAVFSLLGCAGCLCMFAVSRTLVSMTPVSMTLVSCRVLAFIGRNTLTCFIWHMYAVKVLLWAVSFLGLGAVLRALPFTAAVLLTETAAVAGTSVISIIINRYFAFSVGGSAVRNPRPCGKTVSDGKIRRF